VPLSVELKFDGYVGWWGPSTADVDCRLADRPTADKMV